MKKGAADLQLSRPARRSTYVREGDNYQVDQQPDGSFLVRHFPDYETRRHCCKVTVSLTDEDRAKAIPDADPHGVAACLARADRMIQEKHARIVDKNRGRA